MRSVVADQHSLIVTSALAKAAVGRFLVADLPLENVVWCFRGPCAPVILSLMSSRNSGASGVIGCEWIDEHRQLFVFDLDHLCAIGGDIAILCNDEGDFLVLEQNFPVGQIRSARRLPGSASSARSTPSESSAVSTASTPGTLSAR